jgi:choline dehydrogenase-like flavoprotein
MWAAMRKAETFHGKPWFNHDPKAHGDSSPVNIEPHDIAPISEMMLKSLQSYGLPQHDDMFSNGEYPIGCGHALQTHHNGVRSTGANYITGKRAKDNVEVLPNTLVDRVNLEQDGNRWRASSVNLLKADGSRLNVKARREIVVSGGAYCSPAILMRSGIGDPNELNAVGIETVVDLPGVGKNPQDHVIAFVPYEINRNVQGSQRIIFHGTKAPTRRIASNGQKTDPVSYPSCRSVVSYSAVSTSVSKTRRCGKTL